MQVRRCSVVLHTLRLMHSAGRTGFVHSPHEGARCLRLPPRAARFPRGAYQPSINVTSGYSGETLSILRLTSGIDNSRLYIRSATNLFPATE